MTFIFQKSHIIKKNKIINYGNGKRCLTIGDYYWIGVNSFIGKNTILPDYTIVAAHSVVTQHFSKKNTILAGNPAKIVKKDVMRLDLWKEALQKYDNIN